MPEQMDGSYYAEKGMVWRRPKLTVHEDGSSSVSMGFPVCKMHEAVGPSAAAQVAAALNLQAAIDAVQSK